MNKCCLYEHHWPMMFVIPVICQSYQLINQCSYLVQLRNHPQKLIKLPVNIWKGLWGAVVVKDLCFSALKCISCSNSFEDTTWEIDYDKWFVWWSILSKSLCILCFALLFVTLRSWPLTWVGGIGVSSWTSLPHELILALMLNWWSIRRGQNLLYIKKKNILKKLFFSLPFWLLLMT